MAQYAQGQPQRLHTDTDMYNQHYNQNSDTELINLANEAHPVRYKSRPFDWFICSVLGYLLCPCTGICAMYYAIRSNHAMDWERDPELIQDHTRKAKCLTLTSIIIGGVIVVGYIIFVIVMIIMMVNAEESKNKSEMHLDGSLSLNN